MSSIEIEDLFLKDLTKIIEYFSLSFEIKLVETASEKILAEQLESSIYKIQPTVIKQSLISFK